MPIVIIKSYKNPFYHIILIIVHINIQSNTLLIAYIQTDKQLFAFFSNKGIRSNKFEEVQAR